MTLPTNKKQWYDADELGWKLNSWWKAFNTFLSLGPDTDRDKFRYFSRFNLCIRHGIRFNICIRHGIPIGNDNAERHLHNYHYNHTVRNSEYGYSTIARISD